MYDKFKSRYIRYIKFKNFIIKHISLIFTLFIVLLASITILLMNKGNILSSNNQNITIIYGDNIDLKDKVFLGKPHYIHSLKDSEEWNEGLPTNVGEYKVRMYGKGIFNNRILGEPFDYTILKRKTDFEVLKNELYYGEEIETKCNLAITDRIYDIEYDYVIDDKNNIVFTPIKDEIIILDKNNKDVTDNYEINIISKKVKFHKQKLVIETKSIDEVYNGNIFLNSSYSIKEGKLGYQDKIEILYKYDDLKDACSLKNEAKVKIINSYYYDVTHFYEIELIFGDINIRKKDFNIKTFSSIKKEDGNSLSNHSYKHSTLLNGHKLDVFYHTTLFNPGTIVNDIGFNILDEFNNDVTNNYSINKDLGLLTICPNITISSSSSSKEYDGSPLYCEDFRVNKEIPYNHTIKVVNNSNIVECGVIRNVLSFKIVDNNNNDVTNYYDIKNMAGELTVYKRKLTLTSSNDKKEYDGEPFNDVSYETDRLVKTDKIIINDVYNLNSNVGIYENSFSFSIRNKDNKDITSYYDVTSIWNKKEILPRKITVKSSSLDTVYNGNYQNYKYYEISSTNKLVKDHKIKIINDFSSFIDSGFYSNNFSCSIINSNNIDVSFNYNISYEYGYINIRQRKIGIITQSKEILYDGKIHKLEGYSLEKGIIDEGLLDGHNFIMLGDYKEFSELGSYINSIDFKILDQNNNDITSNYSGEKFGIITIYKPTIIVTTGSSKKIYDGLPLTNSFINFENVHNFECDYQYIITGTITYAGKVDNSVILTLVDKNGKDITNDFTIIYKLGELEVIALNNGQLNNGTGKLDDSGSIATKPHDKDTINDKEAFTYETDATEKIYFRAFSYGDYSYNKWLKPNPYKYMETSPLYYSSLSLSPFYEEKYISMHLENQLDYLLPYFTSNGPSLENDCDNKFNHISNYNLKFIPYVYDYRDNITLSSLTNEEKEYYEFVKQNYLSLPSDTKNNMLEIARIYGLDKNSPNIIMEIQNFVRNHNTYNEKFREYPENLDIATYFLMKRREGNSQHFATSATCMYRALGIPARYTVGFISTPYTHNNVVRWEDATAWVEVYLPKFGWISIDTCKRAVTSIGHSNNIGIDYTQNIVLKPKDVSKGYDGSVLNAINEIDLYESPQLAKLVKRGYTYKVKIDGSRIELGSSPSIITDFILYDEKGIDVTEDFLFTYKEGNVSITKRQAQFIIKNKHKYYDGTFYKYSEDDVSVILPAGYKASYDIKGELNKVGKESAIISNVKIVDSFNNDVTDTFFINVIGGHLSIDKILLEITLASDIKKYDRLPLYNNNYWISKGSLIEGHKLDLEINSKITEVGKIMNIPTSLKIVDSNGNNVKYAYEIYVKAGTLEILP